MTTPNLTRYRRDPVGFIDHFITHDEKGRCFMLSPHQRRVLEQAMQWDEDGRLMILIFLWSEMKKSGKTFIAACLALWWAFTNPNTEIIIVANDLEQSVGRVFKTIVRILKQNPALVRSAKILAESITLSNDTTITAIASDYKGAAGSRHSLVVYDELWGFSLERAERLFEELTPPPTEPNAWVLIVTYAGWTGESLLLERLYKRGLTGKRIDDELELYRNDDLTMFWSHTPRQPWQTEKYYNSQREILRPNTFARLHENRWVMSESAFLTAELWDACVDPSHHPLLPDRNTGVVIGVDAAPKHDMSAVVAVQQKETQVRLAFHRLWKPASGEPLDLEATVEAYLRQVCAQYHVVRVVCDPFQLHRSITTLRSAGLPIEEFPQTTSNCTRMGQTLFDLLKGRNLQLYPNAVLREQALNTVAIENPRGFRIAKEKASRKIDAIAALSMACVAAMDLRGRVFTLEDLFFAQDLNPESKDDQMVRVGSQQVDPDLAAALRENHIAGEGWR